MDAIKDGLVEKQEIKGNGGASNNTPAEIPTKPKGEKASRGGKSFTIK